MINKQKNSIRVMAGVLSFTLMFGNISSVALTDTNNRVVCAEESEGLLKEIKRKENKIFYIKKELERINDEKIQVSNWLKEDIKIIREYEKSGFCSKSLCDKKIKEYQEHLNRLFEESKKLEAQFENEKEELAQLRLCKLTEEKKVKELSKRNDEETETKTKEEVINLFETTKRDESKEQFRENKPEEIDDKKIQTNNDIKNVKEEKDGDTEKRLRKYSNECLLLFYEYIKAAKVLEPESSETDDLLEMYKKEMNDRKIYGISEKLDERIKTLKTAYKICEAIKSALECEFFNPKTGETVLTALEADLEAGLKKYQKEFIDGKDRPNSFEEIERLEESMGNVGKAIKETLYYERVLVDCLTGKYFTNIREGIKEIDDASKKEGVKKIDDASKKEGVKKIDDASKKEGVKDRISDFAEGLETLKSKLEVLKNPYRSEKQKETPEGNINIESKKNPEGLKVQESDAKELTEKKDSDKVSQKIESRKIQTKSFKGLGAC